MSKVVTKGQNRRLTGLVLAKSKDPICSKTFEYEESKEKKERKKEGHGRYGRFSSLHIARMIAIVFPEIENDRFEIISEIINYVESTCERSTAMLFE